MWDLGHRQECLCCWKEGNFKFKILDLKCGQRQVKGAGTTMPTPVLVLALQTY